MNITLHALPLLNLIVFLKKAHTQITNEQFLWF